MGQSFRKVRGSPEKGDSASFDCLHDGPIARKERAAKKKRFEFGISWSKIPSDGKNIGNENKSDGINLKDFQSTTEIHRVEQLLEDQNKTEITVVSDSNGEPVKKNENIEDVKSHTGSGDEDSNFEAGKEYSICLNESSAESILILLKLANGVTSPCTPEEVSEGERKFLESRILQLETPCKWLSDYKVNDEVLLAISNEGYEIHETHKNTKVRQDYLHITTYHLCQSAIFCEIHLDHRNAVREVYQANLATKRFSLLMEKQKEINGHVPECIRKDQDIIRHLNMVVTGTIAHIAYQMTRYNEVKILLQEIENEENCFASRGIIKGIQSMTLSNIKFFLPASISIIRETIELEPNYWRWHMVLAKLLQNSHDPDDTTDKIMRLDEISKELLKVYQLKKKDPVIAISLGDSYCNSLFFVRNLKNSLVNYEEYAEKAVNAYTVALNDAPHCALTHARVARSFWNLRRQHREAFKKGLVAAEKAMAIILSMDIAEDSVDQLGKIAEATMILGLFWESAGNADKALTLFRMAASNPYAHPQVAYRSELGVIIGCFQNDNKKQNHMKTDVLNLLDKLLLKFLDANHKQQTLCHKGQFLMDVKKEDAAALDEFIKAIMINPNSPYLKNFYPRFTTSFSRPVRISDMIHELACKELSKIITKAKKGCPEAIERSNYLNKCIQISEDPANASQFKTMNDTVVIPMNYKKQNALEKFSINNDAGNEFGVSGNLITPVQSVKEDIDASMASVSLNDSSNLTYLHQKPHKSTEEKKDMTNVTNTACVLGKDLNKDESSSGKLLTSKSAYKEMVSSNVRDDNNHLTDGLVKLEDSKKIYEGSNI